MPRRQPETKGFGRLVVLDASAGLRRSHWCADQMSLLHPELLADDDRDAIYRNGRRLDHAEGASKPLRARPEPQPRGAKVHGNRPIDQAEAAARFIAAPEHEKMHDERLWDLRRKRDSEVATRAHDSARQ
jgi:hypothetical protein